MLRVREDGITGIDLLKCHSVDGEGSPRQQRRYQRIPSNDQRILFALSNMKPVEGKYIRAVRNCRKEHTAVNKEP